MKYFSALKNTTSNFHEKTDAMITLKKTDSDFFKITFDVVDYAIITLAHTFILFKYY
jgi:hypothetical protein